MRRALTFPTWEKEWKRMEEYYSYRVRSENLSLHAHVSLLFHRSCLKQLLWGQQSPSEGGTLIHRWGSKSGISSVIGNRLTIHIIFSRVHLLLIINTFIFCWVFPFLTIFIIRKTWCVCHIFFGLIHRNNLDIPDHTIVKEQYRNFNGLSQMALLSSLQDISDVNLLGESLFYTITQWHKLSETLVLCSCS